MNLLLEIYGAATSVFLVWQLLAYRRLHKALPDQLCPVHQTLQQKIFTIPGPIQAFSLLLSCLLWPVVLPWYAALNNASKTTRPWFLACGQCSYDGIGRWNPRRDLPQKQPQKN